MSTQKWSEERKKAASDSIREKNRIKKETSIRNKIRIPVGVNRDITAVKDTPDGYIDRWVNDTPGRIDMLKKAGYEQVPNAHVGDEGIDGTHSEDGVVSRDMGKGVTAYLMRQRMDYFEEDQREKENIISETENSIRRSINENRNDGMYGEVKVENRKRS